MWMNLTGCLFFLWKITNTTYFECISLCLVPYRGSRAAQHIVWACC
uniref:Uncharacterized protein n=1 Tax=Anguilla anguilla TaxID=7936 RepID=A0A0E9QAW6_ANGAN